MEPTRYEGVVSPRTVTPESRKYRGGSHRIVAAHRREMEQPGDGGDGPAIPSGRPGGLEALSLYLRGALIGVVETIPGVSGGTVALVVGVYERLIMGLSAFFAIPVRFLRSGATAGWAAVRGVPWFFLVMLGLGMVSTVLLGAHFIPGYYERWPVQANALFFGLILGSIAVPWHRIRERERRHIAIAGVAGVVAFLLAGLPERLVEDPSPWMIVGGAMVAISALVLPGVSGSYLLHVMGLWVPTLEAVSDLNFVYLAFFGVGAVIGAALIVRVVSWLLLHHHDTTLAVLVGLMIGSLRALWPWMTDDDAMRLPEWSFAALFVPLLLILGGFFFVRLIDHWARRRTPTKGIGPGD